MFPKGYFTDAYFPEQYFGPVVTVVIIEIPRERTSSPGGSKEPSEYSLILDRVYRDEDEIIIILREVVKCLGSQV